MKLTKLEKEMLAGVEGEEVRRAMEIVTGLGKIFGADSLLPVKSVQVAGVSYQNIGDAGILFLEDFALSGRVKAYTTLNPAGIDIKNPELITRDKLFVEKQTLIISLFEKMGIQGVCTCTPYLVGNLPLFGEHIAWSESSAVCFANSVIGAKTNREGGPGALAAAICGRTANYGLHRDENRKSKIRVEIKASLKSTADFSALGLVLSKKINGKIPCLTGLKEFSVEKAKALSSALATFSEVSIFKAPPFTPEPCEIPTDTEEIGLAELKIAYRQLNDEGTPDVVCLGCPHLSYPEFTEFLLLIAGRQRRTKIPFWLFLARGIHEMIKQVLKKELSDKEIYLICDTCIAVAPVKNRFQRLATNSAKLVFYARGTNRFATFFDSTEKLVERFF